MLSIHYKRSYVFTYIVEVAVLLYAKLIKFCDFK